MWDIITAIAANPATIALGAFVGRNLFGWFVNSMKDGHIQGYEWGQLGKTIATLTGMGVFLYLGVNVVWDVSPEQAALMAAFIDVLRSHFK